MKKSQWNLHRKWTILIPENAFEKHVCKMAPFWLGLSMLKVLVFDNIVGFPSWQASQYIIHICTQVCVCLFVIKIGFKHHAMSQAVTWLSTLTSRAVRRGIVRYACGDTNPPLSKKPPGSQTHCHCRPYELLWHTGDATRNNMIGTQIKVQLAGLLLTTWDIFY